jgi:hypothetical protein
VTPLDHLARLGELDAAGAICRKAGITLTAAIGKSHRRTASMARFQIYRLLHSRGMSLPEIGRVMGRDHTSVLAGLRRLETGYCGPAPRTTLQLMFLAQARAAARAI